MKLPVVFTAFKPMFSKIKNSGITVLIMMWFACLFFVWWKGAEFTLGEHKPLESLESRWLITAILVIIAISFISLKMIHRLKTLESRQQEDKKKQHNPIQEEIDEQRRYLDHWVNKFKRFVDDQQYQYVLPWYLVLGAEQSGKKTLLREGGDFIELYDEADNVLVSKNLSIFTNDQAVVICPSHSFISQLDNIENKPQLYSKLWGSLLNWIKVQRPRQPLNGIILTLDLHEILVSNKEQKEQYITLFHQRLIDVLNITQGQLPISIIMTKLDLLNGFDAFYETLTQAQREEVLGVTFTGQGENWKPELEHFWYSWLFKMNNMLPDLLFKSISDKKNYLFSYVRQLATAIEILSPIFEELIANGGKSFHFLKGVYFTSSMQNGKIDDIFVQSASEQYHLGVQTYPVWAVKNSQTYFSRNLFKETLFNSPNIAQESKEWQVHYAKKVKAFSIAGGIAAVGLIGAWHYYYNQNHNAGINVLDQVKKFKDIPISNQVDNYGDKQLPILNPLRDATLSYGDHHDKSYLLKDMGLYQGNFIGPYVDQTYLRLLNLKFLPAIMNGLLTHLNNAPEESEEKLEILRVMRMLDDKTGRDDNFVKEFMKKYWSKEFKGKRSLQNNLMAHLDYALKHTDWFDGRAKGDEELIEAFKPYELSVKDAQQELSRSSIYNRVYQNLKIKANSALPAPLDYRDEIGAGFDSVYIANDEELLKISRFFTEAGLKNYFIKQNEHIIDLIAMDNWVLNLKENMEYSDADREKISERISELYLNDYISTWRAALNNLDIKDFASINEAVTGIEKITGGEQTLKRALSVLAENTAAPKMPNQEGKALQDALNQPDYQLMSQIDHSFSDEKLLLGNAEDKSSSIQAIYQKLSDLHRYLLAIQNSPDSGKAALKAVQLRLDQNSTDPILELQQLAKTMPQPVSRWIEQIADYSWRAVLKSAIAALEIEWNEKVVKQYKTYLKGRYPFVKNAQQEVPLSEFTRFFAPGGTIDSFYETNLKPFIESDLNSITDDSAPLIREDVLTQLAQAQRIKEVFFKADNGIGVQYTVEPLSVSANKRRSVLNLDGQIVDYAHGLKKQSNIVWPNSMNNSVESKLTLVSTDGNKSPRSLTFKGPWAQIKLLTSGRISNVTPSSFDIRYDLNDGYATYRVHIDEAENPFNWENFDLSETLY